MSEKLPHEKTSDSPHTPTESAFELETDLSGLIPAPKHPLGRSVVIASLVVINVTLILGVQFLRQKGFIPQTLIPTPVAMASATPSPRSMPSPSSVPTYAPTFQLNWSLKKNTANGKVTLLTRSHYQTGTVAVYGNMVYYTGVDQDSKKIMALNLDTEARTVVMDITKETLPSPSPTTDKDAPQPVDLSQLGPIRLDVVDDTLFISYGDYMAYSPTFWMDLKHPHPPKFLAAGNIGHVVKWGSRVFLSQMEGDSCAGWGTLSLIDMSTKTVTKLTDQNLGCSDGSQVIGYDAKRDRLLLGTHVWKELPPEEQEENDVFGAEPRYTSIDAIALQNGYEKTTILPQDKMPADSNAVLYLDATDEVLIKNRKTNWSLKLETGEVREVASLPQMSPSPLPMYAQDGDLKNDDLPDGFEWVRE